MHHQCKSVQSVSSVGNKPFSVRENVLHPSLHVAGAENPRVDGACFS